MKAIGNFLLIKEIEAKGPSKTKGGLLVAKDDRENIRYSRAVVMSVGNPQFGIKENDEIYFDRYAGHDLETKEGNELKVIKATDIVAVL